ncbi:DNA-directed RNA polymerase III subunit RPC4 isoform X2 [Ictalurus furcatus]|uniref:DNA-directed RNA polymerase III subunit RPC4 isoform X2 n=1 Tax=Ictalurus furcatus TaxID=66913 RepID=UPI0023504204|nr:DNA-directed RNA polymerase III subunit RPC4 isoform X2 [Ictalurus furcatus]
MLFLKLKDSIIIRGASSYNTNNDGGSYRMAEGGDREPVASSSGTLRPSFSLGRGLAGRSLLNPPPPGRLTSLRSRDLTLGGYKKKTFVPNVHSIRKSKDELKEEPRTAPKKERREREDRQRERRRRERPQTIQSHSIFEQGPADTFRKTGNWGTTNLSEYDPSILTRSVKKERNVPEEDDDGILEKLQRDDFIDDPGLKNDPKQTPIRLPLHQSFDYLATDTSTSLKEALSDHTCSKSVKTHERIPTQTSGASAGPQPPSVGDLFQQMSVSEKEELLFIQLPDTIPVPIKALTSEKSVKKCDAEDKRASYFKAQDPGEKEAAPVLSDFTEGFVGKVQIRKSGKVQLVIGDVTLDVSEGAAFSFLQQLVCVRLTEGLTGDMTVLGDVKHKLVCSPDFEALLKGSRLRHTSSHS